MHGIARLTFSGGERLMPARNGYDRELVFDEAECCAKRHGEVRLELSASAVLIRPTPVPVSACAQCERPIDRIDFAIGARHLCRRCVRLNAR
ncbi:hypothetical protein KF840_01140 [bacterium]|nr:hypothetical protein [bacterium]